MGTTLITSGSIVIIGFRPTRRLSGVGIQKLSGILIFDSTSFTTGKLHLCSLLTGSSTLVASFSSIFTSCLLYSGPVTFSVSSVSIGDSNLQNFIISSPLRCVPNTRVDGTTRLTSFVSTITTKGSSCTTTHTGREGTLRGCASNGSAHHVLDYFNLVS